MNLEREAGTLADALYKAIDGIRGKRAAALGGEHKGTIRELAPQLPQCPQLVAAERVH